MEDIEKRAKAYANERYPRHTQAFNDRYAREHYQKCRDAYIKIAEEQKAIDDAELARLKEAWQKEAEMTHDDKKNYQQGWHDATDKVCKLLDEYIYKYVSIDKGFGIRPLGNYDDVYIDSEALLSNIRKMMEK